MDTVTTVPVTMNVPKESKEVIDLLKAIAQNAKEGKKALEYADLIDELAVALNGVDKIPAELKSEHKEDVVAYLVKEVGGVFI